MWGAHCLSPAHFMPWFGHTGRNRDTARNLWMTMLHISNGRAVSLSNLVCNRAASASMANSALLFDFGEQRVQPKSGS